MTKSISSQTSQFPAALIKSVSTPAGGVQATSSSQPTSSGPTPKPIKAKKSVISTGLIKKFFTKKPAADNDHVISAESAGKKSHSTWIRDKFQEKRKKLENRFNDLKPGPARKDKGKSRSTAEVSKDNTLGDEPPLGELLLGFKPKKSKWDIRPSFTRNKPPPASLKDEDDQRGGDLQKTNDSRHAPPAIPPRNSSLNAPKLSTQAMPQAAPTVHTAREPGHAKASSNPSPKPTEQPSQGPFNENIGRPKGSNQVGAPPPSDGNRFTKEIEPASVESPTGRVAKKPKETIEVEVATATPETARIFESIADADNELRRLLASRETAIGRTHTRNRNTAIAGPSGQNVDPEERESEESTDQIDLKIIETSFFIEGEAVRRLKIENSEPETGSMYENVANFVAANSEPGSTTDCAYERLYERTPNGRPWIEKPRQMLALEKTTGDQLAQEALSGNRLTLSTLTPTEKERARLTGEINRARMTYDAWKVTYDGLTQNPTKNPTENPTPHNKRMFANVEASRELLVDTMNKIVQDILAMAKTGSTDAHVRALQPTASPEDIEKALVQAQETVKSNNKRNPPGSFQDQLDPIEHPLAVVRYAHEAMKDITGEKTRQLVKATHTLKALSAGGYLRMTAGTAIPDAICAMLHALVANLFGLAFAKYVRGYNHEDPAANAKIIMFMTMLGLGIAVGPVNQTVGPTLRWFFASFLSLHILVKKKGEEVYGDASQFTISKTTGRSQELSDDELANDQKQVQVKRANWDQLASKWTFSNMPGAIAGMAGYAVGYGVKGYYGWSSLAAPVVTTLLSQLAASVLMVNRRAYQTHEGEHLFKLEEDTTVLLKAVWDGLATLDPSKFENLRKFFNSLYSGVGSIGAATLIGNGTALLANDHLGSASPTHEALTGAISLAILVLIVFSGTEHDPKVELERAIMAGVGIDPKDKNAVARWASHQANPLNWAKKYLPFHTQEEGWFGRGAATVLGGATALSGGMIDNISILTANTTLAVSGILKDQAMAIWGHDAKKISEKTPVRFNAPLFASQRLIVASTPPVAPV